MNKKSFNPSILQLRDARSAFTLIETLVVTAIVIAVSVGGFLGLAQYRNKQALEGGLDELRAAVENAKRRSVAQEEGNRWGVRFTNATSGVSSYSVFKGASYATSGVVRTYSLRTPVGFGNPSASSTYDASFAPLSGALSANKVLTLVGSVDGLVGDLVLRTVGAITARTDKSLAGYWHLDEGTGTSAYDASGNGRNGTLTGGPTWQSGSNCKAGGCVSFDGTDDYLDLGTSALDELSQGSVGMWMRLGANGVANGGQPWQNTTFISNDNVYLAFQVLSDNRLRYYYYDGAARSYDSASALSLNAWYFVAATWDASGSRLYINGALDASSTLTWSNAGADHRGQTNYLGKYGGGYYLNGKIDEVHIWNRVLTASEVEALYNDLK
ncbi:MAG: hypothetical protein HYU81_02550 [Candidatus Brennerbacteria bacterium]|nr:hypothetical protein [Candidatus Brennerbacteria bacterium]